MKNKAFLLILSLTVFLLASCVGSVEEKSEVSLVKEKVEIESTNNFDKGANVKNDSTGTGDLLIHEEGEEEIEEFKEPTETTPEQKIEEEKEQDKEKKSTLNDIEKISTEKLIKEVFTSSGNTLEEVLGGINLDDEKYTGQTNSNDSLKVLKLVGTCESLDGEGTFMRTVEEFYDFSSDDNSGEGDINIIKNYTGSDFCLNEVFNSPDNNMCFTSFDKEFINKTIGFYVGKISEPIYKTYLNSLQESNVFIQKSYSNFFLNLLKGNIKSLKNCKESI